MHASATASNGGQRIFHVSSREGVMEMRDAVLRMHGFEVRSSIYSPQALDEVTRRNYDLVLIDVEAEVRVQSAQELCDEIKKAVPGQHVAFVCNYRVAIESDCPDEIIRSEFNPEALVRGVQKALEKNDEADKDRAQ
jgi:DNA-binding NtrC family response regulator